MSNGQRLRNTRKENELQERPVREFRQRPSIIPFSSYVKAPDTDSVILRHMAPVTYHCKTVTIHIDSTDGVRVQFGVNDTEFIERDLVKGENVFQVERVIPEGTRIKMQVVTGSAVGIWVSWAGEA